MANFKFGVRVRAVAFGRGVFAARPFKKGETIGTVSGRVIDDESYWSEYCIDLGGTLSLEPKAPFRYLNHSCEPNSRLYQVEWEYEDGTSAESTIDIVALRSIPLGAELTIDYAWPASGAIPCLCGSSRCRGWVVSQDELPDLLQAQSKKVRSRRRKTVTQH